jgi:hypothetical protein
MAVKTKQTQSKIAKKRLDKKNSAQKKQIA